MDSQTAEPPRTAPAASSVTRLSLLLNVLLLGWAGYAQFGRDLFPADGISLVLANDTSEAMVAPTLEYPGGAFKLDELAAGKAVGTTIPVAGPFEATLKFQDAGGSPRSRTLSIRPIGDLLVALHVLPEIAPAPAPTPAADAPSPPEALPPAPQPVRVIVAYQGENTNI